MLSLITELPTDKSLRTHTTGWKHDDGLGSG